MQCVETACRKIASAGALCETELRPLDFKKLAGQELLLPGALLVAVLTQLLAPLVFVNFCFPAFL
jgi:hypothetical protein